MGFFLSISSLLKNNDSKTSQTSFLILMANKNTSKAIPKLSLIKLTWASGFLSFSLHFKHTIMVEYNALNNN